MAAADSDLTSGEFFVKRGDGRRWLDLTNAITDSPVLSLSMDGAPTITIVIRDDRAVLLRDPWLKKRSWVDVAGRRFELVKITKAGRLITLTFEDGIVGKLRRQTSELSIPAGSLSRAGVVAKLAREAGVPLLVDDSDGEKVHSQITRSKNGQTENSWDLLGSIAEVRNWRRFSDGKRLIVGPDAWLIGRDKSPVRVNEPTSGQERNPVDSIDFDLDVGKPMSEGSMTVDATRWAFPAGSVVDVHDDLGPGAGKWLVWGYERPIARSRATVQLRRKQHELEEPPKAAAVGDGGVDGYIPTAGGSTGAATTGARERMVQFALAQSDKPYVFGASGPSAYDCSGLVQAATAYAGKVLPKPSAAQAARCAAAGVTIPVATAIRTRGALLFRIGVAEFNHVAISLGNGSTVEARGTAYGCGVFGGAASEQWTSAALWI